MRPAAVDFPDFNHSSFLVIWEVTRACALACVHCRADAMHRRDPRDLTTDEVFRRLRNGNALFGTCGRCGFREICGGSRSRAFAATGAVMASDPLCAYEAGPDKKPLVPILSADVRPTES